MMKWVTYLTALGFTFFIGYFLGGQSPVEGNTTQTTYSQKNINDAKTLKAPILSSTDIDSPPREQCHCNEETPALSSTTPSTSSLFNKLLQHAKYTEAVQLFSTIESISEDESKDLLILFTSHINQLFERQPRDYARIDHAINTYLADFYNDLRVLTLLVKSYSQQARFHEGIRSVQLAYSYAYTDQQRKWVNHSYEELIRHINNAFTPSRNWEKLIEFYLFIFDSGLLTRAEQFNLIKLYLLSDNYYQASIHADALKDDPLWQQKVADLLKPYNVNENTSTKEQATEKVGAIIPLKQVANQFIAPVNLSKQPAALLIDTGASMTTISKQFYTSIKRSVNMTYQSTQHFLTANGRTRGDIYQLDELHIGEYVLKDINIAVLDYPTSKHSSGLLGMNVLRHFRFEIDQRKKELKLSPP